MSTKVKERLQRMNVLPTTTHEERQELDRVIEEHTQKYCDDAVGQLTDEQLLQYLKEARERLKKSKKEPMYVTA
ncbi:MAG TPA: hypothetical protein VJJ76_00035 [archaeon]|nr:hypothetical protein [archaeon]